MIAWQPPRSRPLRDQKFSGAAGGQSSRNFFNLQRHQQHQQQNRPHHDLLPGCISQRRAGSLTNHDVYTAVPRVRLRLGPRFQRCKRWRRSALWWRPASGWSELRRRPTPPLQNGPLAQSMILDIAVNRDIRDFNPTNVVLALRRDAIETSSWPECRDGGQEHYHDPITDHASQLSSARTVASLQLPCSIWESPIGVVSFFTVPVTITLPLWDALTRLAGNQQASERGRQ